MIAASAVDRRDAVRWVPLADKFEQRGVVEHQVKSAHRGTRDEREKGGVESGDHVTGSDRTIALK